MSTMEIIRDEAGNAIGTVCVRQPLTDDERSALAEVMQYMRQRQTERDPKTSSATSSAGRSTASTSGRHGSAQPSFGASASKATTAGAWTPANMRKP